MINVLVQKTNNKYKKMTITGHAQSGKYGEDLICAGVTAIVGGALNGLDELFKDGVNLAVLDNRVEIVIDDLSNQEIQLVCEFIFLQLKTIEVQYPKNITLKEVT
ncbi:ribosomal-processing cysteine protease Prp [Spiroplasma alleghenense]|uniref:Ribosomal processing cysteine protease Prp n=1 Tax=Spiroplasma alleghenense TaxID=216931 RepID=A0A345Z4D3_9MOLU|nr:ribosomal-processing cysteine protease Prp [Spiroplasma alleghenense]AXK51462.1 hypothetical protein SALLE_v1c07920 [Spiroplasma alleghenense]